MDLLNWDMGLIPLSQVDDQAVRVSVHSTGPGAPFIIGQSLLHCCCYRVQYRHLASFATRNLSAGIKSHFLTIIVRLVRTRA
jgi:hypothetical protein